MPTTRSASRAAAAATPAPPAAPAKARSSRKRKASDAPPPTEQKSTEKKSAGKRSAEKGSVEKKPKKRAAKPAPEPAPALELDTPFEIPPPGDAETTEYLPAQLTFSFEDAKDHLVSVDVRFEDVFSRLTCGPYEKLERIDPFSTLTTSILGQQISWLAARSVRHKFIRLYFPELPEKPDEKYWARSEDKEKFPTPQQVAQTSIAVLRTAGLSGRKAEYVQDLAARFADGRLTSKKVFEAEDEELYEMLTAVRGIGRWTVDMFAIFSLRRPDIMPSGDLGVQRGVLRWFLSLHSPDHKIGISPKKLAKAEAEAEAESQEQTQTEVADGDVLPSFGEVGSSEAPGTPPRRKAAKSATGSQTTGDPVSAKRPRTAAPTPSAIGLPSLPPTFTPSFSAKLGRKAEESGALLTPLPAGLTVSEMKARLAGKKKVKGALATPAEMEALTEPWKPYRSLGAYYMWALAEEAVGK